MRYREHADQLMDMFAFVFHDTATTAIYPTGHTLSLPAALPIWERNIDQRQLPERLAASAPVAGRDATPSRGKRSRTAPNGSQPTASDPADTRDRKSTRLNSSH